jgi:hypothetical protein
MYQKLALFHQLKKISQDGLYQKLVEQLWKNLKQIEIKPTIPDPHLVDKQIQKIEQDHCAISVQAREHKRIN